MVNTIDGLCSYFANKKQQMIRCITENVSGRSVAYPGYLTAWELANFEWIDWKFDDEKNRLTIYY